MGADSTVCTTPRLVVRAYAGEADRIRGRIGNPDIDRMTAWRRLPGNGR